MDLELKGKTAIVTGSGKGIGKAIAKSLHEEGCNVMLNGRNEESLINTIKTFQENSGYFVADVTQPQASKDLVVETIKKWGRLDILVCNVGLSSSVKPGKEDMEEWSRVFKANFLSTTNIVEASIEHLSKTKGSIVCISSIAGLNILNGAPITYASSKSALNAYVRGIARPLGKKGIRINAIAPGNILFKGSVWDRKLSEDPSHVERVLENEVSLGRLGKPEEIADFVSFLASSRASFATGGIFVVDGGQLK